MKKRILLISPTELCVGGVSKVLMTLVEELHEEYSFDLVTLCSKPGYYDDAFSSYGGKIYRIPCIQYLEHKILYPLSFFQIKSAMKKILKENHYDIIHGHSGWQDAACHVAAAGMGLPVRISHGLGRPQSGHAVLFSVYQKCYSKICHGTACVLVCGGRYALLG